MPRALWWVLAAGALVWAAAFVGAKPRTLPAPASDPEPAVALPKPPEPVVRTPTPSPAPAAQPPTAFGPPAPNSAQPERPRGIVATATASWRAARDVFGAGGPKRLQAPQPAAPGEVATGELGDGVFSPEFHALERAYTHEPRDGEWAPHQERAIRFAMRASALDQQLTLVNCQQTICRMLFEGAQPDAFTQLVANPELAQLTGLTASSPHSYRSGQLSVYFARRSAIVEGTK